MPRPRRPGAPEPKRRSRKGCWPCKARKVKCDEEKPSCLNCRRQNENCDYSIRLNWEGRTRRKSSVSSPSSQSSGHSAHLLSLAVLPSDFAQVDSLGSGQGEGSPQELTPHNAVWATACGSSLVAKTSCSRELENSHEILTSSAYSDHLGNSFPYMSDRTSVGVTSSQMNDAINSRPDTSPQMMTMPQETLSSFTSSTRHPSEDVAYPDTSLSIRSLATLNFSQSSILSLPLSFIREFPMETHRCIRPSIVHPRQTGNRGERNSVSSGSRNDFPFDTNDDRQAGVPSPRHRFSFAHSDVVDIDSPSAVRIETTMKTPGSAPTETYFTKVMNGPIASEDYMYSLQRDAEGICQRDIYQPSERSSSERKWSAYLTSVTDNYGLDHGRPDLDLNQMDDHSAIDINYALDLINPERQTRTTFELASADHGLANSVGCGYYASPVPINIPRYLSPLPLALVEKPINLMYFHHFLNHTAKMLVAHDCGDNPFITVLPSMAIGDSNILNLMLAYSASHRARYLNHPEPANRIAHWVSNVFPTLRIALEDPDQNITDNHLAAAIMLLSLKIISPSTFEVPIPWQSHLKLARDLYLARGVQMAYPGNRVGSFLSRWLEYIDVMGSLSCRDNEPPLFLYQSIVSACSTHPANDDFFIDCFTGYTAKTALLLSRLAKLVHQCERTRVGSLISVDPEQRPSSDIVFEAESLLADFQVADNMARINSRHHQEPVSADMWAIDRSFRYAGLVHLHRRVLCSPSASAPVLEALDGLFKALGQLERGSAEVGALFPLFTAGCETRDLQQQADIMQRVKNLEKTGLKQIQNARTLMQRCWNEDLPWSSLAQGEFLG
ncbi:Zn(II)2Cys6 transcription factor [Aspergillus fischeri NRRL 181]|uniref:C6 zinc finger domain protein n=1 Tax=Neosartorya fischeri (strain ATCC 1020 / DSM 3700 / CBS 544.65 / FGSC A1164 / JCM 1740 / NRRL 181 / WB 181) TaxID=331117 RepID=A1D577_NEOFI|nr:C6 zinc finger domain protein [Aspergillus fischeri NRRL 181]EAW23570.1 C6 zinc finger domain protein [Aspergillus fischeri NRRL 181]